MKIEKVSIIGLGALGIMYANHLSKHMESNELRIIADENRINRYKTKGIYCNGEKCNFQYVTPEQKCEPADLLIFAVKYTQLQEAIELVKNHVGEETIILSVLNGVVSENEIGEVYGHEHNLYCVAQGMDAVKEYNHMRYKNMGLLCFGELNEETNSDKVKDVAGFFDRVSMPYEINNQMAKKLWGKLMINVGVNQTVSYFEGTTKIVQEEGPARKMMIEAMKEVLSVAQAENIGLTQRDFKYWIQVLDKLNSEGMPSMRQDFKAKRYSEVELFAGTIVKLAKKHGLKVPVNELFYKTFTEIEAKY